VYECGSDWRSPTICVGGAGGGCRAVVRTDLGVNIPGATFTDSAHPDNSWGLTALTDESFLAKRHVRDFDVYTGSEAAKSSCFVSVPPAPSKRRERCGPRRLVRSETLGAYGLILWSRTWKSANRFFIFLDAGRERSARGIQDWRE